MNEIFIVDSEDFTKGYVFPTKSIEETGLSVDSEDNTATLTNTAMSPDSLSVSNGGTEYTVKLDANPADTTEVFYDSDTRKIHLHPDDTNTTVDASYIGPSDDSSDTFSIATTPGMCAAINPYSGRKVTDASGTQILQHYQTLDGGDNYSFSKIGPIVLSWVSDAKEIVINGQKYQRGAWYASSPTSGGGSSSISTSLPIYTGVF